MLRYGHAFSCRAGQFCKMRIVAKLASIQPRTRLSKFRTRALPVYLMASLHLLSVSTAQYLPRSALTSSEPQPLAIRSLRIRSELMLNFVRHFSRMPGSVLVWGNGRVKRRWWGINSRWWGRVDSQREVESS